MKDERSTRSRDMGILNWLDGGSFHESKKVREKREENLAAVKKTGHSMGCSCPYCDLVRAGKIFERTAKILDSSNPFC